MLDRDDPRDDGERSRGDLFERQRGSRGASDRADVRGDDGRSAFSRHFDLPRGLDRELVRDRKRSYELNGQESAALATIGAFRVVHADDLRDVFDREGDLRPARQGVRHLQVSKVLRCAPTARIRARLARAARPARLRCRSARDLDGAMPRAPPLATT